MAFERARLGALVFAIAGSVSLTARAQVPPTAPAAESAQPIAITGASPRVYGPPPRPETPPHTGFLFRLQVGIGFTALHGSGGYLGSTSVSGGGGLFGVAMGGKVASNLAVFGSLLATTANNPDFATGGVDAGRNGGSAAVGGFGAGLVYYFEPINVYVSGALVTVSMRIDNTQGTIDESKFGYGIEGIVGREWWLSRHWGLGVAAELLGATGMTDKYDPNLDWSAVATNLLFSATYF